MIEIKIIRPPSPTPVGWGTYPTLNATIKALQHDSFEAQKNDLILLFEGDKPFAFLFVEKENKVEYYSVGLPLVGSVLETLTPEDARTLDRAWNVMWLDFLNPYVLTDALLQMTSKEFVVRFLVDMTKKIYPRLVGEANADEKKALAILESTGTGKGKSKIDFYEAKRRLASLQAPETDLMRFYRGIIVAPLDPYSYGGILGDMHLELAQKIAGRLGVSEDDRRKAFLEMGAMIRKVVPVKEFMRELGRK